MATPSDDPAGISHDHVLPDGTTVYVRPITPEDAGRLLRMWDRTSDRSRRQRFHGSFDLNERTVKLFTEFDPALQFALVATLGRGEDESIVGVARYVQDPDDPSHAEFAALVEDAQQGRGVGTALVRHVAMHAYEAGVRTLSGDVLADNARMLRLINELGFEHKDQRDQSVVRSDLGLELGESFLRVVDEDERKAATASLNRFFSPESIAVVGASRDPKSIGGLVFDHILHGRFAGVVYPVNPNAQYVSAVQAYPSVSDLPTVPDLVLVCVPARFVAGVVDEAGTAGVRAVCIVSAGFSEAGEEGRARHDELMEIVRAHGMRVVGPNCMGIMNATEGVRMNGTFSSTFPMPGRMAFSSQSGALGLAVIEHANDLGLGLSTFVSVGNKADISGNDLLLYWDQDPDTDVILLYLESFGNPRKFSRIARRISRHKPIVAVKSGRTGAGVRAASSHTAAISAGDVAVEALFKQAGVIRTDTLEELFDVATLLSSQPLPRGTSHRGDHQRRRAGDPGRRRVRVQRPARAAAVRGPAGAHVRLPAGRGRRGQPRRHDRVGQPRRVRGGDHHARHLGRGRRDVRDLHPHGHHGHRGHHRRDGAGPRAGARRRADRVDLHVGARASRRGWPTRTSPRSPSPRTPPAPWAGWPTTPSGAASRSARSYFPTASTSRRRVGSSSGHWPATWTRTARRG